MASVESCDEEPKVTLTVKDEGMQIHISCVNRRGLFADLVEAIEKVGFLLEAVNATCETKITLDVFCSQTNAQTIDTDQLLNILLEKIHGGP
eukprot:c8846_g1_i1 orf=240-515(-)